MAAVRASAAAAGLQLPVLPPTPRGRDHSRDDDRRCVPQRRPPQPLPRAGQTTRLIVVAGLAGAILIASAGMLAWWWRQRDAEPGLG